MLDGNAVVPNNTVVPHAVVTNNTEDPCEKSRLDECTAWDWNDKALSILSVVHGDYTYVSFDRLKGDNVYFLNKIASETAEETSNEKEGVKSDE